MSTEGWFSQRFEGNHPSLRCNYYESTLTFSKKQSKNLLRTYCFSTDFFNFLVQQYVFSFAGSWISTFAMVPEIWATIISKRLT